MDLTLNNRQETISTTKEHISIAELLVVKNFSYKMLMVRVNGKNVRKDEYNTAFISDGDNVEVIHLISGG